MRCFVCGRDSRNVPTGDPCIWESHNTLSDAVRLGMKINPLARLRLMIREKRGRQGKLKFDKGILICPFCRREIYQVRMAPLNQVSNDWLERELRKISNLSPDDIKRINREGRNRTPKKK